MVTATTLARIDRFAWIALYAGLFGIVLGIVTGSVHAITGWTLGVLGTLATIAGIVLIIVRSRLPDPPAAGAQSPSASQGET
ncbi:MAG TPA: hypothetical protein VMZ74_03875 [Ramlibacter sp.]|nr:hypothetical protein [Ramlibacter sp.]